MIRELVQTTLDASFNTAVKIYWQKKSGADAEEYIIYSQSGDNNEVYADNEAIVKSADITVQYYYRAEKIGTPSGRTLVKGREAQILSSMKAAGFTTSGGPFDAGDIDNIGYFVTAIEFNYARAI